MWTRSNLPLTAAVLAHGELFLQDIASRMLIVGHGFGKRRDGLDLERKKMHSDKSGGRNRCDPSAILQGCIYSRSGMLMDLLNREKINSFYGRRKAISNIEEATCGLTKGQRL